MDLGRWEAADEALKRVLCEPDLPEYVFWFAARLRDHLALWRGLPLPDRSGSPADPQRHPGPDTDIEDLLGARYTYLEVAARHEPEAVPYLVRSALADDRVAINPGLLYPLLSVVARTVADRAAIEGDDGDDPELGGWAAARIGHLLEVAPPRNDRDRAWEATIRADLARRLARDRPEDWSGAVAAWRGLDQPHPLGWTLLRWGVAEASVGHPTDARRALAEALTIGEALGATPLVDTVLAAGRQARLRLSPATAPAGRLGLTERELDVLRLVAEGLPNAAIGQRLFISPKTVSVHVSHILDKLGVATRGGRRNRAPAGRADHPRHLGVVVEGVVVEELSPPELVPFRLAQLCFVAHVVPGLGDGVDDVVDDFLCLTWGEEEVGCGCLGDAELAGGLAGAAELDGVCGDLVERGWGDTS